MSVAVWRWGATLQFDYVLWAGGAKKTDNLNHSNISRLPQILHSPRIAICWWATSAQQTISTVLAKQCYMRQSRATKFTVVQCPQWACLLDRIDYAIGRDSIAWIFYCFLMFVVELNARLHGFANSCSNVRWHKESVLQRKAILLFGENKSDPLIMCHDDHILTWIWTAANPCL